MRDYQDELIGKARLSLRSHQAIILCLPTGGGKTQIAVHMMQSAVAKGGRPWFLCHRDYLVEQTSKTLAKAGIEHGFVAPGRMWNPWKPAQVASIDTLRNRLDRVPPGREPTVLFVDEAQHSAAGGWLKVIEWAKAHGSRVVGLSATPERLDGKPLSPPYEDIVIGPTVEWLIEQEFLSRYTAFAPTMPDLSGVSTRAGDFSRDELEAEMDKDVLTGNMVGHYIKCANGKRAIYFCVSIAHSKHVCDAFKKAGVRAVHLDGGSAFAERKAAAVGLADGTVSVITCADLIGEGFDLAAQAGRDVTVECVGLARPTQSLSIYLQQVGRALRPKPDPAIILDHAGNVMRHGLPDDERVWSLEGKKKNAKKAMTPAGPAPRVCLACFAQVRANSPVCTNCGAPFGGGDRILNENDDELVPVNAEEMKRHRKMQEQNAKTLEDLIAVGRARGYERPERWAAHLFSARARKAPRTDVDAQAQAQRRW